ncbi:MAG: hypothetical protein RL632_1259 [Bacteroidota bacterium]
MKKVYLLISAVSFGAVAFGQVKVHNAQRQDAYNEPTIGEKLSDFAPMSFEKTPGQVLFSETFAGGIGAWTTAGVNAAVWLADTDGPNGQYSNPANEKIGSTTVANGFMIFDADLANPGSGPYPDMIGSLVSPVIDLTGQTNVILSFEHRYRSCCSGAFYPKLEVSTDNFATMTEFDVRAEGTVVNVTSPTTKAKINLSAYLATATNLSNFKFRFTFDGTGGTSHYHWQVDDVNLIQANDNDLTALSRIMVAGSQEIPYYFIPVSQQTAITFSGETRNDGGTSQAGVKLTVSADNAGGSVSSPTVNLAAGAIDSLITATWTPAVSAPVNYALTYTFSQTQTDATPTDNVKTDAIKITNSVYSVDNGTAAGSISNLSSQPNQPLKIGNVMEIMAADRLDSMYITLTTTATNVGQEIFGEVYLIDAAGTWNYLTTTPYNTITAQQNGTTVKLPLESVIDVAAGDVLLVVACHTGGATADVRFRTAQPVAEGIVQGFDATGAAFFLSTPNAVMVRLNMNQDADISENTSDIAMSNVFPNPTSGMTTINYTLANASDIHMSITDLSGKVIYTQVNKSQAAGSNQFAFDAANFANGVYYVTVRSGESVITKKFVKK